VRWADTEKRRGEGFGAGVPLRGHGLGPTPASWERVGVALLAFLFLSLGGDNSQAWASAC
jgi:hypothetical protein